MMFLNLGCKGEIQPAGGNFTLRGVAAAHLKPEMVHVGRRLETSFFARVTGQTFVSASSQTGKLCLKIRDVLSHKHSSTFVFGYGPSYWSRWVSKRYSFQQYGAIFKIL